MALKLIGLVLRILIAIVGGLYLLSLAVRVEPGMQQHRDAIKSCYVKCSPYAVKALTKKACFCDLTRTRLEL